MLKQASIGAEELPTKKTKNYWLGENVDVKNLKVPFYEKNLSEHKHRPADWTQTREEHCG